MKEEAFRRFLSSTYKSQREGQPLSSRAVGDCVSRLRRAEKVLGIDADRTNLDHNGLKRLAERLEGKMAEIGLAEFVVHDCMAALRRYSAFKESSRS
jgi:glycosyltransferase A (GT-A) superfamily protein (DUF2064 family)